MPLILPILVLEIVFPHSGHDLVIKKFGENYPLVQEALSISPALTVYIWRRS